MGFVMVARNARSKHTVFKGVVINKGRVVRQRHMRAQKLVMPADVAMILEMAPFSLEQRHQIRSLLTRRTKR